jgi:hypothetical protein
VLAIAAEPGVLAVRLNLDDKSSCLKRGLERAGQTLIVFG